MSREYSFAYRAEMARRAEIRRMRIREVTGAFLDRYEAAIREIADAGVAEFVAEEIEQANGAIARARRLQNVDVEAAQNASFEVGRILEGLKSRALEAKAEADVREAFAERAAQRPAVERAIAVESLAAAESVLGNELAAGRADATRARALMEQLARRRKEVETGAASPDEAGKTIAEVREAVVTELEKEQVRRETLSGIFKAMAGMGFVLGRPTIQDNIVRVEARKASGERCLFLVKTDGGVEVDGSVRADLKGYHGAACRKDMSRVMQELRSAYGLQLSAEQIVIDNPEEIGREADRLPEEYGLDVRGGV